MRMSSFRTCVCLILLSIVVMPSGCSDRDGGKPKIRKKSGIATKIDVANRVVSMTTTNKAGQSIELPGTFNDDTVVLINGRTASIQDIREGDKVEVEGYREGEGQAQKLIATRVVVDRPEDQDWKSSKKPADKAPEGTPAPTTQPANG